MNKFCPRCSKRFPDNAQVCPHDGTNLVQLDDSDLVGSVLDNRYSILARIGKGGMGVVYKAEQHLIERIVALKVLNKEIVKEETAVKRFMNEAKAIASLENPHTVTLYDFGVTTDGLLYYTMELLDGRPLSTLLKDEGPLAIDVAARILFETLESLEEAHAKGILHRDIKPDNLFLQTRSTGERIKVLDFGIAKLVGDGGGGTAITKTGMICGTPQYLSPEQVIGNPAVPASDLYSLAVVFYEMLAGMPPFFSPTPMKLLLQHLNEAPAPISVKNPRVTVPASINRFVERALAKQPEMRFASVADFRAGLKDALSRMAEDTESLAALVETSTGTRALSETTPVHPVVASSTAPGEMPASIAEDETQPLPDEVAQDEDDTRAVVAASRGFPTTGVVVAVVVLALAAVLIWRPWRTAPEVPGVADASVKAPVAAVVDAQKVTPLDLASAPLQDVVFTATDLDSPQDTLENVAELTAPVAPPDGGRLELSSGGQVDANTDVLTTPAPPDIQRQPEVVPDRDVPVPGVQLPVVEPVAKPVKKTEKKPVKKPVKKPEKKPVAAGEGGERGTSFKRIDQVPEPVEKKPAEKPPQEKKPSGFRRIPTG